MHQYFTGDLLLKHVLVIPSSIDWLQSKAAMCSFAKTAINFI